MSDSVYQPIDQARAPEQPMYASLDDCQPPAQSLRSLSDVVDNSAAPKLAGLSKEELEYERLRQEALAARNKPTQVVEVDKPSPNAEPTAADRQKLLEQAMARNSISAGSGQPSSVPGGPSAEERARLAQEAMQREATLPRGESSRAGGPSLEERRKLAEAALKAEATAPARKNSIPSGNGPTEEQRRQLAAQAMQSSRAQQLGSELSKGGGRVGGPTPEQRAMLAQQALASAKNAPKGPTPEQRAMLAQQAMQHQ